MTNIKKSLRLSLIRVAKKMTRLSKNRNTSQKVIKNVKMYRPCNKFRHKGLSTKIYRLLMERRGRRSGRPGIPLDTEESSQSHGTNITELNLLGTNELNDS